MKPFLEKIADRLVLKFPNRMEDVAIVLPSKRAVVFFKYYLFLQKKKKANNRIIIKNDSHYR